MEVSERERFDMFVESARAFCSWIEGLPELPSDGLWDLDEALALISALLADGHRLLASCGMSVCAWAAGRVCAAARSIWG